MRCAVRASKLENYMSFYCCSPTGSILPDLQEIVGKNPLFVAVNKVDLLPSGFSNDRVKRWVLNECRDFGNLDRLRLSDIFLVSAKTGLGIQNLLEEGETSNSYTVRSF